MGWEEDALGLGSAGGPVRFLVREHVSSSATSPRRVSPRDPCGRSRAWNSIPLTRIMSSKGACPPWSIALSIDSLAYFQ